MGSNLILAGATMAACLAIQCVIVAALLHALLALERKRAISPSLFGASSVLVAVMLVMLAGNLLQMVLWATLFLGVGEFGDYATAFYHSVVNFATLGYGDLVMSEERRLLGALEAANGVLMFGLTTSFLFAVLDALMRRALSQRQAQRSEAT